MTFFVQLVDERDMDLQTREHTTTTTDAAMAAADIDFPFALET